MRYRVLIVPCAATTEFAAVHDRLVASVCNTVALLMLKVQTDQQPSKIVTN